MGFKSAWKKITNSAGDVGSSVKSAVSDNPLATSAVAAFTNPLAWQNVAGSAVAGSALRGGYDPLAAGLAAPGSLATGGSSGEWMDLAAFNAALLAGAGGAALAGAGAGIGGGSAFQASLGVGTTAGQLAAGGLLAGGLVAAGGYTAANALEADYPKTSGSGGSAGEAPPDINEANDPDLAAQFKRIRKGARMLGRAGTIKYKGAANLGSGQTLGDALALQGS